ncbi:signal transduction histidine kinase [Methanoregula boonei 6A8]|uniref:Signal transduction histidine kinase n=1 Tax=Methanoregula boonei (strain DSM 21154 / JCM 14090 / 6A8) TaxID=456442 RepID=A7I8I4_METB6|nr:PAS domain S-box protein [Methanoregula boonei]ABS56045.1 signal transduction histidine kinase [Methanoregula boonei 6A8]
MMTVPAPLTTADGIPGMKDADFLRKTTCAFAILAIAICIAGILGNISGSLILSSVCRGCKTLALSAALIWIFFGALLLLLSARQAGRTVRILVQAILVFIFGLECIEIAFSLNGAQFIVESWSVQAGSELFGSLSTPISPIASGLIAIAAAGLFFCTDPSLLSPSRLRAREITVISGGILTLMGFALALSYLFGTPLILAKAIIPIAAASALAAFFIGLGLIAAAGPFTVPVCYFMGNSIRARLLRTFVSLSVAITLCETILFYVISAWLGISNEIMISASLVLFIVVTSVIVGRVSEMIGQTLDKKEQELADKNAYLGELNDNLVSAEEKLRQTIETLIKNERDLHESEQFLRETEKIAKIGGWKANPKTDYLQVSEGVYDIFGIPGHHRPGFSEGLNCFSREDQILIRESIETCLATGKPFTHEIRITTGTNEEVWTEIRGLALVREGHLSSVIGTIQDISRRRKVEEMLKRESGKLDILAESARLLLGSEKPGHVVQRIGERVMQFLSCQVFFNYLIDETGQRMELNAYAGIAQEDAEQIRYLNLGDAVCGRVARDSKRMVIYDILSTDDEKTRLVRSLGISGYACHPLIFQGRTLGTISFGTADRACFSEDELDLMQSVTALVATAMAQKQIADTLKSTSQYLESLINYANAPIIVWDPDYRILRFNHAFEFLTGFSADEIIGKPLDILFPEKSRRDSMELIRRTSGGERWESVEIPVMHVSGSVKMVLWNSANVYDPDGAAIVSTIAQGQDITERKNAEETARQTASLLRAALDSTGDGILVVDNARTITGYNKKFCAIWGIPEPVLDDCAREAIALVSMARQVVDAKEFTGHLNDLYNHPGRESYDTVKLKDGRIFERYSLPQKIGDTIVGRVWSYRDITERRQAEIALQESLEKFRVIATSTPDHILVQDKNLRYTQVINPQPGLTGQDMIGKTDYEILSREEADTLTTIKKQVLETGSAVSSEMHLTNARGEKNYFSGAYVPTRNEAGEVDGLIGYFRNVTEKKQANEKILAALAEKEVLIREIHHRVKNNLQIVTGLLDMTRTRAQDPETTGILTDMMLKIKTMARIHTRLYESNQSGQVSMDGQIRDMVTDLSGIYLPSSPGIRCEVDAEEFSLPVDLAIPCALVINEILSNSFKHAFRERTHGTIRVLAHRTGEQVHISIRDDGTGIPEQVDPERTASLGLKLIRNLVNQLQGTLTIGSPEEGTEVTIDFPAKTGG